VARIVLLITSPRLPAGLLTAAAWDLVRSAPVLTGHASGQAEALRSAGCAVTVLSSPDADALIAAAIEHGTVVWLAGPGGDEELARELGLRLVRQPELAELEVRYGSWDPPGARLLDVVTVMDRLAAPDGDPWKREQTHQSLARYLLEEAYEAYDAIHAGDLEALREELGDVLLQVVLHARLGEETAGFSIDDVAGDLVDKLIRRNPHVFAGTAVGGLDEITENWEQIKRAEKARASAMDGLALSQPALSLAAKVLQRAERAGLPVSVPDTPAAGAEESLGRALFALVAQARAEGLDPEAALRKAVLDHIERVRHAESPPSR